MGFQQAETLCSGSLNHSSKAPTCMSFCVVLATGSEVGFQQAETLCSGSLNHSSKAPICTSFCVVLATGSAVGHNKLKPYVLMVSITVCHKHDKLNTEHNLAQLSFSLRPVSDNSHMLQTCKVCSRDCEHALLCVLIKGLTLCLHAKAYSRHTCWPFTSRLSM